MLAPLPGEWSVTLRMVGPVQLQAGVPSLIRLATAPWVGPLLDGRSVATQAGKVHFDWQARAQILTLRCAPCTLRNAALGAEAMTLDQARLTVRRDGASIGGELASGKLQVPWRGEFLPGQLRLRTDLPMTPIADGLALFARAIPELAQARTEGRFAFTAQISLPGGSLSIAPQVEGFQVSGLGTAELASARGHCGNAVKRVSRLTPESWLARAVVSAQDPRFFEHKGFDLAELGVALAPHQQPGGSARAGTLSQQTAGLLLPGNESRPASKLRELLYAVEMEQTLGKQGILRLYLANAPWGLGLCGAEAATAYYFGRRANELSPAQAAWLGAMLHDPELEAARWSDTGRINLTRTREVVMGLRAMPRNQRVRLAEELGNMTWPPPAKAQTKN